MRRFLLALLLCAACKHSTSSSSTSHTETSTVTDSTSSESGATTTVTTTSEAPGKTTITVEEFGVASPVAQGEPAGPAETGQTPATVDHGETKLASPILRKRTVTVTERGAETTETHQQASTQAQGATQTKRNTEGDTKTKGKSASGPSAGCIGASWLWGAAILAGVIGVIYFAVKMRKSMV